MPNDQLTRTGDPFGTPATKDAALRAIMALAGPALSEVARRGAIEAQARENAAQPAPALDAYCEALIGMNDEAAADHLLRLAAFGTTSADIFEHVLPEAARLLGDMWLRDEATFAEVTVGSARIQRAVRQYGPAIARGGAQRDAGCCLLACVDGEDHTIGATMAADLFRREGCSTRIAYTAKGEDLGAILEAAPCDVLGFSIASSGTIPIVRSMIRSLRSDLILSMPIVVGGPICSEVGDIARLVGADFADVHPRSVLSRLGLAQVEAAPLEEEGIA